MGLDLAFQPANLFPSGTKHMDSLKKPFVAPSLTVEASLEDVTLVSGGGRGKKHGHNNNHNNNHNNHNNNHNNGHRGS